MKITKGYTLSQFVDLVTIGNDDEFTNQEVIRHAEDSMETDMVACAVAELIKKYNDFLKQPLTKEMFVNDMRCPIAPCENYEVKVKRFREAEKKVIFEGFEVQNTDEWIRFYNGVRVYIPSTTNPHAFSYVFRDGIEPPTLAEVFEKTNGKLTLKNVEL